MALLRDSPDFRKGIRERTLFQLAPCVNAYLMGEKGACPKLPKTARICPILPSFKIA